MGRELAGVIACLQEVEIACAKLLNLQELCDSKVLGEIRDLTRRFLSEPSLDGAQEVESRILSIRSTGRQGGGPDEILLTKRVEVDGVPTTLEALLVELREVLEDLES